MIVDASLVIDAVADPGPRGGAARAALASQPATEPLIAPGHLAFEVLSGLRAAANRPKHPLTEGDIAGALDDAEALEIGIEAITWSDVRRAWALAQASLRYADAIYVAFAERHGSALLTADARIARSRAAINRQIITIAPAQATSSGRDVGDRE